MPRPRLLLFTKPTVPGRVKTRLASALGDERAAALHAAFIGDVAEALAPGDYERRALWAPVDERAEPPQLDGWECRWQEGEDLGERLFTALSEAADADGLAAPVAAVGSDHPGLDAKTVDEAFRRLDDGADVVLGPAADGGYYLIALAPSAVHRRLFEDVPWSTPAVARVTLERCRELGLRISILPEGRDIDEPADLEALIERLAARPGARDCPRTRDLLVSWGRLPERATREGQR